MQSYRPPFPQQPPQRSPHAAAPTRRGIGPMISGGHPQNSMTPAQMLAQRTAQEQATQRALLRARKPTDKNIPDGVEECIIGDGVLNYRNLKEVERRLDATMMRKRLDITDAVNRNVKRYRTLRVWITNTVEDQPWQADTLDVDAFDFSTNMDSSYRVKIEGRLLDDEDEGEDSEDEEEEDDTNGDAMDADKKEGKSTNKDQKLSHFFKAMTVEFDRSRAKDGQDQNVEWKKPSVGPGSTNLPNAADFDQLEFKRGGDENINITINLQRDENPERFTLSQPLADILDTTEATRAEAIMGIWDYIRVMNLQEDEEKRSFDCDDRLRAIFMRDKGYIPYIPEVIVQHLTPLPPVKLAYTIRVDKAFHDDPQPTIYDIRVQVDDPLRSALMSYITNPEYAQTLREITTQNDHLAILIQKIQNSKAKHTFFDALSKHPTEIIKKWLSSQKRDLEIIAGEATRSGGEDAISGDEWRKGGSDGIWGGDTVRESVNLMVSAKARA